MADDAKAEQTHRYEVGVSWTGGGEGCGTVLAPVPDVEIPVAGAKELGGCGKGVNPEELLLASVGACFVNTWAIFLKKLGVAYAEPSIRLLGDLGKDPAGGYKMLAIRILARVPASLWAERREDLEKTLKLAEKYCIISKVAKAAMPVEVAVEEV